MKKKKLTLSRETLARLGMVAGGAGAYSELGQGCFGSADCTDTCAGPAHCGSFTDEVCFPTFGRGCGV